MRLGVSRVSFPKLHGLLFMCDERVGYAPPPQMRNVSDGNCNEESLDQERMDKV